jgi:hypothetical protein
VLVRSERELSRAETPASRAVRRRPVASPGLGCRASVHVLRAPWPCRYVLDYVADIDVSPPAEPMDFAV